VDRFFSHDFVSHSIPPGLPPGVEGVKAFFSLLRDGLPDIEVSIDELVAEGDKVAVATTISGTHERELMGVPPTGRRVAVMGIDLLRFDDGMIVEHRGLTDTVGLLRQLTDNSGPIL
jgi:predicted ester cyclase